MYRLFVSLMDSATPTFGSSQNDRCCIWIWYNISKFNSWVQLNIWAKKGTYEETASFSPGRKRSTDVNLNPAHPNRTLSDLSNLKSQKINPTEILKRRSLLLRSFCTKLQNPFIQLTPYTHLIISPASLRGSSNCVSIICVVNGFCDSDFRLLAEWQMLYLNMI